MFFLVIGVLLVILVVYALKDKVVEYIQWFKDVQHMRTLPGPPTEWGLGHMRMVNIITDGLAVHSVLFCLQIGQTEKTIQFNFESQWKFPKFHVQWWGPLMPCLTVGCPEYMKKFQRERGTGELLQACNPHRSSSTFFNSLQTQSQAGCTGSLTTGSVSG